MPGAWINGADNVINIPASLFADLADGSFQVSTTGGGVSPPGQFGINRAILQIQVAGCAGTTVGCCTVDEECDDGNDCTADSCSSGTCSNAPVDQRVGLRRRTGLHGGGRVHGRHLRGTRGRLQRLRQPVQRGQLQSRGNPGQLLRPHPGQ